MGLDIGSGYLKLVEVDHGGDPPEVSRIAVCPLDRGAIVEGEIMDPVRVAAAIRELVQAAGVEPREVVTALGGHDVFMKKLEMDRVNGPDLGRVVRREAERHVPFDIGGVEIGFHILARDDEGFSGQDGGARVLLVAAKRECVDNRIALLADAGLRPSLMDVEAFALSNAFAHNYPRASEGVITALVDMGHEVTKVNILEGGAPILTRDIPTGSRQLEDALRRGNGVSPDQDEYGFRGRTASVRRENTVDRATTNVAAGIERATALLATQRPGLGLGRVFLSGWGACIPGVADSLARRMNVETRVVNPFERVPIRSGAGGAEVLSDGAAPMLFLPLGLALRSP